MVVLGAGGHAVELLDILLSKEIKEIVFFDNINLDRNEMASTYKVIHQDDELRKIFTINQDCIIGVGHPRSRKILFDLAIRLGGKIESIIANSAIISPFALIGNGVNIMEQCFISSHCKVGKMSLVNSGAKIHHNSKLGQFCEVGPNATITGNVHIDDFSSIGANSTILPGIRIGKSCVIGAGSVVTRHIEDHTVVKGNPAK